MKGSLMLVLIAVGVASIPLLRINASRGDGEQPPLGPEGPVVTVEPEDPLLPASSPGGAEGGVLRSLKSGDVVPDALLVDQDGRRFQLSELFDQVLVLSFVYTRCNVANMCPTATRKLVEAHEGIRARGAQGVRFLVVSFDTERDDPRRLGEFASEYGADGTTFRLASGDGEEVKRLSKALNTYYRQRAPGVFEHNIVVSIVDRGGVLRDDFFGTEWEVAELVEAVVRLTGLTRSDGAPPEKPALATVRN